MSPVLHLNWKNIAFSETSVRHGRGQQKVLRDDSRAFACSVEIPGNFSGFIDSSCGMTAPRKPDGGSRHVARNVIRRHVGRTIVQQSAQVSSVYTFIEEHFHVHSRVRINGGKTQVWNQPGVRPVACDILECVARDSDPPSTSGEEDPLVANLQASRLLIFIVPQLGQIV